MYETNEQWLGRVAALGPASWADGDSDVSGERQTAEPAARAESSSSGSLGNHLSAIAGAGPDEEDEEDEDGNEEEQEEEEESESEIEDEDDE